MKAIIIIVSTLLVCLSVKAAEKDTMKVNGILYLKGDLVTIEIVNGTIVKISPYSGRLDDSKIFIAPGLVDLQINGFMGVDFSDQHLTLEEIRKAVKSLWKVGVTTFLPTIITNSQDSLLKSFSILAEAMTDKEIGLSIRGFHLEGPYISPKDGFRGAHLVKYIRPPDWQEFLQLQKAAHNEIKIITLAPELNGAISFISKCSKSGVIVSLGHHNGSAEQIREAVDSGASLSTHLGNGCANMISRHDNPLWPQLAEDRLTASIIADGFHLNKEEVKCFYRMKGVERIILVSDALDLAGMTPGNYIREGRQVVLTSDVVKFPAENVLAGAASPVTTGVSNIIKFTGCTLGDAIQMASTNPAKFLGYSNIGEIKVGKRADLILFTIENGRLVIQKTIIDGKQVYSKE